MISYYQAPYTQRGHGFGGIFRGLSKFLSPIASGISKVVSNPTVQSIAKDALKTGVNLTADAIEGRKSNAREEGERLLKRARKKVAKTVRRYTDEERRPLIEDESDSEDTDNQYDVSETPQYQKKSKLRGKLVKKKKRTIFDD